MNHLEQVMKVKLKRGTWTLLTRRGRIPVSRCGEVVVKGEVSILSARVTVTVEVP